MGHWVVDMAGVLASLSVLGTAVGAGLRWVWARGKAAGQAEARQAELERKLQELQERQERQERRRGD